MVSNRWCEILDIETPRLEVVKDHRNARPYTLLIVALLERGEAMTLEEVAARFDAAGIAPADRALLSLKRCKPGRAPVIRDGDHYELDPYDRILDLWAFRLGLRPPKIPRLRVVRPEPEPSPGPQVPLSIEELNEAWQNANIQSWSAQRLALAVLEACGRPMMPSAVVAFVTERTRWHILREKCPWFGRRGCPIAILDDGSWSIAASAGDALLSARKAVRSLVEAGRRSMAMRPDPAVAEANRLAAERRKAAHAYELARMSRVLLAAFPPKRPAALALLDVGRHSIETLIGEELESVPERLGAFDIIAAVDVRALLRALEYVPGEQQRLAELGPPQKTKQLNKRGRTLKITTALLIQGSCGIARPFGDQKKLAAYLANGQHTRLRRRLEADAKSLFALYQYGRIHGALRLRWGFLDEFIPAPWVHLDEFSLYDLMKASLERNVPLQVVVGSAPGWSDPWSRARLAIVERDPSGWSSSLVDEDGYVIDEAEVQLARLAAMRS